jgi:predicted hydrolase (HD superfamily)
LNIIDTPGLIEGGYINEQAVEIIKRYAHFSVLLQHCLAVSEVTRYRFYRM